MILKADPFTDGVRMRSSLLFTEDGCAGRESIVEQLTKPADTSGQT